MSAKMLPLNLLHDIHRDVPHDNINSTLKIRRFISQQIVDKSRALSSKQFLCMHAFMF